MTKKQEQPKEEIKRELADFEFISAPDHAFAYTDNAQVRTSMYDIKLMFGVSQGRTPEGKMQVAIHSTMAMSPQHAKALLGLLQDAVDQYEERYMPINLGEYAFKKTVPVPAPVIKK
jgi:hypothetical protein